MSTRRLRIRKGLWLSAVTLSLLCLSCEPGIDSTRASPADGGDDTVSLPDVNQRLVRPLVIAPGQQAVVLIFVGVECPICNAYAGEINRLSHAYASRGVRFFLVDVDATVSAGEIEQHARQYQLEPTVLLDPKHMLARKFAASTTPEVILVDRNGSISYRGRIDDLYIRLGQRRYEASEHDLRDALDAVTAGRPAPIAVTQPVGCAI